MSEGTHPYHRQAEARQGYETHAPRCRLRHSAAVEQARYATQAPSRRLTYDKRGKAIPSEAAKHWAFIILPALARPAAQFVASKI